jgi:hypothetical protein
LYINKNTPLKGGIMRQIFLITLMLALITGCSGYQREVYYNIPFPGEKKPELAEELPPPPEIIPLVPKSALKQYRVLFQIADTANTSNWGWTEPEFNFQLDILGTPNDDGTRTYVSMIVGNSNPENIYIAGMPEGEDFVIVDRLRFESEEEIIEIWYTLTTNYDDKSVVMGVEEVTPPNARLRFVLNETIKVEVNFEKGDVYELEK